MKYNFVELDGKSPATQRFTFVIDPAWNVQKLRLAVFVQDMPTGVVYQAVDLRWHKTQTTGAPASGGSGSAKDQAFSGVV
jgi:hypothetical protein